MQKIEHPQIIEKDKSYSTQNTPSYSINRETHKEILVNFIKDKTYDFKSNKFTSFISQLENCLSDFINALDYYIVFIDGFSVEKRVVDIQEVDVDKVISFNYTDTYRILYYPDM